ncbi:MAG: YihY/virulence factor BrkB family protein, partial [Nocardioides sp.]|nr:YihY/virulence factor BrkB family protein [Nocardioides sp.]
MSVTERVGRRIEAARERWPFLDHAVRTQEHYGRVNAGSQAGAVTYFAFLSFFPLLALAFFVVGYIARYFPDAQDKLVEGIEQVFPGMIGGPHGISLDTIQRAATTVGIIGLATLIYAGLGWLSGMRKALQVVFELPRKRQPSFVFGKLRDLLTLVVVGSTLLVSIAVSGVVTRFSTDVLDLLKLGHDLSWLVEVVAVVVALVTSTLMFFILFTVLARPRVPDRSLWMGAFLGSVAFEILKQLSSILLAATERSPAFQAFGVALILLIWINYFSRIVMYAAAWAHTSPAARALRATEERTQSPDTLALRARVMSSRAATPGVPLTADAGPAGPERSNGRLDPRLAFAAGAAV